jgi:two-component system copper resistance phosphate regulon response regulator CusR
MSILILSALGETDEKVKGLESGADDYLTEPFHISELIARIRNLAHRMNENSQPGSKRYQFKDLTLNLENQSVRRGTELILLTSKEFKILSLLMGAPHKIFSKSELLDRVWNINQETESNVVEVAMNRLRTKINTPGHEPLGYTKRGGGYSLSLEDV